MQTGEYDPHGFLKLLNEQSCMIVSLPRMDGRCGHSVV
jgi:hypothetical protein